MNTQQIITSGSGTIVGNTTPQIINQDDVIAKKLSNDLLEDYNSSRENTQELMEVGKQALQEVLAIASQGQHPRFFEAAALMIKTLNETNMNFMDSQEKLYRIRQAQQNLGIASKPTDTTKIVFMGTTKDLLDQLKAKTKTIDVDED